MAVVESGIISGVRPSFLGLGLSLFPSGVVGFCAGYLRPSHWCPLGLVAGLPVAAYGAVRAFRAFGSLSPFEVMFFIVWLGSSVLGARAGQKLREARL